MKTFESIASNIFKIPVESVRDNMTSKDISGWDSMNYLLFISELEKNFKVSLSMDEVLSAKTLGDVKAAIRSKNIKI